MNTGELIGVYPSSSVASNWNSNRVSLSNIPWRDPTAAYIHVPFCRHHCGYCDFAVVTGREQQADAYLDALEREISGLGEPRPVATIFIGGGTPTALAPPQLMRLLTLIRRWLPLNAGGEWSVESTPDTLDATRVDVLADHGVTRVSIGVQSFREALLMALDRVHSPADNGPAVERVKARGQQVSLDLIFGIPGQTPADWRADLAQALELEPDHLSCYGLTFEKGTPLWKDERAGRVKPVDEEAERTMFLDAHDTLTALGWDHYEISNYARQGRRCRHNGVYWANHAYYGFGLGAARYVNGRRELNTRSFDEYLSRLGVRDGGFGVGRAESSKPAERLDRRRRASKTQPAQQVTWSPTIQSEQLDSVERARETLSLNLRRREGANRKQFLAQTGFDLDRVAGSAINRHVAGGLLVDDGSAVAFTRDGFVVADTVLAELWACESVE